MRTLMRQRIQAAFATWITALFFVLALTGLLPWHAEAQQVITTYSMGSPNDPFNGPQYLAFDKAGNLFVSDTNNHRVQRIDMQTGVVTTVVGTGTAGYSGDGGPATKAQINCPLGLAFDAAGNLYVADQCQNVVRKVLPGADSVITGATDESITSVAGNGTIASCVLASGTASQTPINAPSALATDQAGNLFMIAGETLAGSCSQLVQRVDATSGFLTTVEIIGSSPTNPGMAFDNSGNLFVWEFQEEGLMCPPVALTQSADPFVGNSLCRSAFNTPPGMTGEFEPQGMAFDMAGSLYLSNGGPKCADACPVGIYKLTPASGTIGFDSIFSLYAGNQQTGYSGDGGLAINATLNEPTGIAFNSAGSLFIADTTNNAIRVVLSGVATPTGTPVTVDPVDQNGTARTDVSLTFDNVTGTGNTAIVTGQNAPPLPANFEIAGTGKIPPPVFYDIVTSAQFSGNITVCITPSVSQPGLSLWHFNKATGNWEQVSTTPALPGSPICGVVTSLSPFAVLEPITRNQAPAITSASSATFQAGVAGSFSVTTSGSPTAAISASGAFPSGVFLTDHGDGTAALGGTPAAGTGGTYPITITATNGVSPDASQSFALTVNQAPAITSINSATFTVGTPGTFTVVTTGFPAPALSESASLPSGVSFNPATGMLSVAPASGGVFNLTFMANNGVGATAVQSFTLTVNQAPGITSANNANFTVGTFGAFTVTSTGFPAAALSESGALPSGIAFVNNGNGTGTLSGTATASGGFPITITASNGVGGGASQSVTLNVAGGNGGPIATLTPSSFNFGNIPLFHLATGEVSLQNTGTSALTISKMSLTLGPNTDKDDFFFLSLCGNTVAPGKSCAIYFLFYADVLGSHTATLNILDNASGGPNTVSLAGTAIKPIH